MRVVHAVTLITPDGAFGGPVRVALNQARELQQRGHDVEVVAASSGYAGDAPTEMDGVQLSLFPARRVLPGGGFSGLAALGLAGWARRNLQKVDVLHVHAARDLITLPLARYALSRGTPYVLQPHGMIDPSHRMLSRPLDAFATRRTLRGAAAVFYLTSTERAGLVEVARDPLRRLTELGNGVPGTDISRSPGRPPEVLFLARLQERKRPLMFASMAEQLLSEGSDATFHLVGPDEGEGPAVQAAIANAGSDRLAWEGAIAPEHTLERLSRAALYVLPAVNEPYPMAVLEALSVGCPVVVTESCGLAPAIRDLGCGVVVDESRESLVQAVRELLADPSRLETLSQAAVLAARERFSMGPVVDHLSASIGPRLSASGQIKSPLQHPGRRIWWPLGHGRG